MRKPQLRAVQNQNDVVLDVTRDQSDETDARVVELEEAVRALESVGASSPRGAAEEPPIAEASTPAEVLADFYHEDYPQIVAAITVAGSEFDAACEAVDDAVAYAWQEGAADGGRGLFASVVRTRALSVARKGSQSRRRERRAKRELRDAPKPDQSVVDDAIAIDIQRVLETLSPRQRQVVVAHYMFDMTVEDVARELGISQSTVKTTLKRARTLLARRLSVTDDDTNEDDQ